MIFSVLDVTLIPDDYFYVVLYVCIIVLSFVLVFFFYFILSFLKLHYDLYLAILHELTSLFYFIKKTQESVRVYYISNYYYMYMYVLFCIVSVCWSLNKHDHI